MHFRQINKDIFKRVNEDTLETSKNRDTFKRVNKDTFKRSK